MGRTTVFIDIDSVRIVMNHRNLGTQLSKNLWGCLVSGSVGAIQSNLNPFKGAVDRTQKERDIIIYGRCLIYDISNLIPCGSRQLLCMIQDNGFNSLFKTVG